LPDITTLFEGTDGVSRTLFNQKLSDVNAHGNNTTMHVTAAERAVWNGKANGNNAVWVATEVGAPDNNNSCVLTIPNFIFTEGCQITYKATAKPKSSTQYNCIKINNTGDWYALRNPVGEVLDDDAWEVGANVTVTLSSKSFNHPRNWPTAFFKGGSGSIKEMYDFPLSIQTTEPTPVNTNHIWIQNATKMELALDEAIRAGDWGGDNRYYALVDSTDSSYILTTGPMKTTDGVPVSFVNRHINRDICPWAIGATANPFAKKYGFAYYNECYSKWPRIMSRINGVIDVENAKRWDGSAWQWLSQKGHYVFTPWQAFNRTDGVLSTPRPLPNAYSYNYLISASNNGVDLALLQTNKNPRGINFISRNGDAFSSSIVQLDPTNLSFGVKTMGSFSPDNMYFAIPTNDSNGIAVFKKNGSSWAFLKLIQDGWIPSAVGWRPDSSELLCYETISTSVYGRIAYYKRTGDNFTLRKTNITNNSGSKDAREYIDVNSNRILVKASYSSSSESTGSRVTLYDYETCNLIGYVVLSQYAEASIVGLSNICALYSDNVFYSTKQDAHNRVLLYNNGTETLIDTGGNGNLLSMSITMDKRYLIIAKMEGSSMLLKVFSINLSNYGLTLVSTTFAENLGSNITEWGYTPNMQCW